MDVVIVSHFTRDFSETDNGRFFYLAKKLARNHDVEIITSSFSHGLKKQRENPREEASGVKITYVDEPGYPTNVCLKRFVSHFEWGRNLIQYLKQRKKPDVVYCAVPSLSGPYFVARYCNKNNIRFVIDVQDLWPEAFRMAADFPIIGDIVYAPFTLLADGIYRRADAICAVSDTYCQRAARVNKKVKQTTTVFLGTELATFDRYTQGKIELTKPESEIWLAYCGTLGSSYDLTCIMDAMVFLDNPRVRLIVMGDGPRREEFERYAQGKGVQVKFTGRLRYERMCALLSRCDICVNPIAHKAAQSIINKHADYAASGLPVVSTQENEEYRKLVDDYQMGFSCNNGDAQELAGKLRTLVEKPELRDRMGRNARRCAVERFDRNSTYVLLQNLIRK